MKSIISLTMLVTILFSSYSFATSEGQVQQIVSNWNDQYFSSVTFNNTQGFVYVQNRPENKKVLLQIFNGEILMNINLKHSSIAKKLDAAEAVDGNYRLDFPYKNIDDFVLILDEKTLNIVEYEYEDYRNIIPRLVFPVQ